MAHRVVIGAYTGVACNGIDLLGLAENDDSSTDFEDTSIPRRSPKGDEERYHPCLTWVRLPACSESCSEIFTPSGPIIRPVTSSPPLVDVRAT